MNYRSFIDIFLEQSKKNPDRIIYRFMEWDNGWKSQDITMRHLLRKSVEIAHALEENRIKKGDRVIIFSMQDFNTVYSILGCMMAGVTFTVIPPPLDEGKVERFISVLKSCSPKALISNYSMEKQAGGSLTKRLIQEAFSSVIRLKRIYSDRLTAYKKVDVVRRVSSEDLAYLQYTSGSTSAPKGVRITHGALMEQLRQCDKVYDFNNGKLATWVPFFHNLGLVITILMPIVMDHAQVYFLSTLQFLSDPRLWIRMMSDYKLDLTVGPGSAFDACTRLFTEEQAKQFDLSHMTHLMNGSEYISPETVRKFSKMFNLSPNAMAPGYGLAENVCLASVASLDYRTLRLDYEAFLDNKVVLTDAEDAKEIVTVGPPVDGLQIVVADPKTGEDLGEDHIGEIFLAGKSLADGYWHNKATRNFHILLKGYDHPFYKTGDLGFLHDGFLYLSGRAKEMLIVNGHNIFPSDLLSVIRQRVPSLSNATIGFFAVTGETKENIIAVIESSPDEDFITRVSQIGSAVSDRFQFSFYDIIFVPYKSLPRTDNNKLQTTKTKALYQAGKLKILHSSHEYRSSGGGKHLIDASINMADDVLIQVKSIFERVLHIEQYSLQDSFLELGGNSLMGFELLNKIEETFKIKLDLREMLQDSSVLGVTEYVKSILKGGKLITHTLDLEKECVLDESIVLENEYDHKIEDAHNIFLTGATGFLGAHFIKSMIEQYPKDSLKIHCLVRCDSTEAGLERIRKNMTHFECWDASYVQYLSIIPGDLSMPNLGIDPDTYSMLSEKIDAIYHNGAMLNFIFPYQFLKTTNVGGTIETLRLACKGRPKYYHYISSYSVYDTPDKLGIKVFENDSLKVAKGFSLAYSETKWVSEKLVGIARERGLKAAIYRPGDIVGSANGIWHVEDMVSRIVVGMIQMKSIPRTRYCMHMTPVDYVGDAIVHISRKEECIGTAFNIINPKPVPVNRLFNDVRACGYTVRHLPFPLWLRKLKSANADDNSLVLLLSLFDTEHGAQAGILRHFVGKDTIYSTSNTALLLNGSGISCPPVDRQRIAAYLKYFEKEGYIKK